MVTVPPSAILGQQRLGKVDRGEEVDREHDVALAGVGNARIVEQGIDRPVDLRDGSIDRGPVRQVCLNEHRVRAGRFADVQHGDVRLSQFREQIEQRCADPGRSSGHDDALTCEIQIRHTRSLLRSCA